MAGPIEPVVGEKHGIAVGPVVRAGNARMIPILRSVGTECFLTLFQIHGLIVLEN